jgi:uncharacterized LabA/DUF88 family protein
MEDTIVYIDSGFLSKLSRHFGNGKYLKHDAINMSKILSKKQNLSCRHIFYYTAPPFQSNPPTDDQRRRKEGYDRFKVKISHFKELTFREGRVQKVKDENGQEIYKQKGVDTLIVMDLMRLITDFPNIKNIILIACDSDFVPTIEYLKKLGIVVLLGTYFVKKRNTDFSRCNHLMQSVSRQFFIEKGDFEKSLL